ncbi:MAG: hypothetical protein OEW87_10600 [Flavobacteriaceae bacterium]|nr:hypothetical protein [Flavobacteriaceae bacterium]
METIVHTQKKFQNPLSKGLTATSLRASINAHCYMCMGGQYDDVKTQKRVVSSIRECKNQKCPLWSVKPFTQLNSMGNS